MMWKMIKKLIFVQSFTSLLCFSYLITFFSNFINGLSPQPAPPRDAHFVSTKKNEPQLLEPIPYEFMA